MQIDFSKEKEVVCISGFLDNLTFGKVYQIESYQTNDLYLSNNKKFLSRYPIKSSGLYNFIPTQLYRKIKLQRLNNEIK